MTAENAPFRLKIRQRGRGCSVSVRSYVSCRLVQTTHHPSPWTHRTTWRWMIKIISLFFLGFLLLFFLFLLVLLLAEEKHWKFNGLWIPASRRHSHQGEEQCDTEIDWRAGTNAKYYRISANSILLAPYTTGLEQQQQHQQQQQKKKNKNSCASPMNARVIAPILQTEIQRLWVVDILKVLQKHLLGASAKLEVFRCREILGNLSVKSLFVTHLPTKKTTSWPPAIKITSSFWHSHSTSCSAVLLLGLRFGFSLFLRSSRSLLLLNLLQSCGQLVFQNGKKMNLLKLFQEVQLCPNPHLPGCGASAPRGSPPTPSPSPMQFFEMHWSETSVWTGKTTVPWCSFPCLLLQCLSASSLFHLLFIFLTN